MPEERITAEQALAHPWFAGMHNPLREPSAPGRLYWVCLYCMYARMRQTVCAEKYAPALKSTDPRCVHV